MYIELNNNPLKKSVGDCVIRAISLAEGRSWDEVYLDLMVEGFTEKDITSSNVVWGSYLRDKGYKRNLIPDSCPNCYTIEDFTEDHPQGTFILATGTHAVCAIHGNYYDTWDSGKEVPVYYFEKENGQ